MSDGLCACGCGKPAPIATKTDRSRGWVQGLPVRFISGHNKRKSHPDEKYRIDPVTGCWNWLEQKDEHGYARMKLGGKFWIAHRWFYEREHGSIPNGMPLDHLCRNRGCVNPRHLEVVTVAENTRRGVSTKLTLDDVARIRELLNTKVKQYEIAEAFGVCQATISHIKRGKSWSST